MDDKLLVKSFTKRTLLFIAGFLSMSLGILGFFLPLLPTTPFLHEFMKRKLKIK